MKYDNSIKCTKESYRMIYSRFSHELRNPLAIIMSELQRLLSIHPELADCKETETIQNNLEYIQELLQEYSKLQNAETLSCHTTDLAAYLKDIVRAVEPSMEYLGISLTLETDPELPLLSIDRIRMRQVLLNLLRNSQEALPSSGGKIIIRACKTDSGKIHISVSDNGCGIPSDQLPKIFDPYVTFKQKGTGLGLFLAKEIINAHGGQISVESNLHSGTVFHILLQETVSLTKHSDTATINTSR